MKRILLIACSVALCTALAPAQAAHHKAMKGAAMSDQQFVNFAAQTDMVEANLGQLAESASSSQPVKDYGQMLVTDHTNDYHQLWSVAQAAGLTVPGAIDSANNKAMIAPFQKLKGKAFDRRFAQAMIAGHTKAIAAYKKEAASAQNASLQSYAQSALPVLEKHLDAAKKLLK